MPREDTAEVLPRENGMIFSYARNKYAAKGAHTRRFETKNCANSQSEGLQNTPLTRPKEDGRPHDLVALIAPGTLPLVQEIKLNAYRIILSTCILRVLALVNETRSWKYFQRKHVVFPAAGGRPQ